MLEFNVRLGDPETQPLMHRMQSRFRAAAAGRRARRIGERAPGMARRPSVCVVLASGGYPGSVRNRQTDRRNRKPPKLPARPCSTPERAWAPAGLETAGGRVLGVTAAGADLAAAIDNAYARSRQIHFDGMHYRTDIGRKGLKRYSGATVQ